MKVNELRIGNYVNLYNTEFWEEHINELCTVIEINSKMTEKEKEIWKNSFGSLALESKNKKEFNQFSEYAKPIPLTEKWLSDFGFKKTNESEEVERYSLNGFEIAIHEEDGKVYFVYQHMVLRHIINVHQLQNLYFAITGTELSYENETK